MKDPLRIFTKDQLDTLNEYNLRLLKKEFFKPLKFGGETTIHLNNHEVGEQSLTEIFNELEGNLDTYLVGLSSAPLMDFLSSGNLDFLFNDRSYNEISELVTKNPKLELRIADKFVDMIPDLCKTPSNQNLNTLHLIGNFLKDFDPKNQEHAYSFAYEDMDSYISNLWTSYSDPFENSHDLKFKDEVSISVNSLRSKMLKVLPPSFEIFDYKFSKWCEEIIVAKYVARQKTVNQSGINRYSKKDKRDLMIFISAAEIAQKNNPSEKLQSYIKSAKVALQIKRENNHSIPVVGIILGLLFFVYILSMVSRCSKPKRSSSIFDSHDIFTQQQRNELNRQAYEAYQKKLEENRQNKTSGAPNAPKKANPNKASQSRENDQTNSEKVVDYSTYKNKKLLGIFSGEDVSNLNLKQIKSYYKADTINLTFETDVLPCSDNDFGPLLPEEVEKGGKHKTAAAYLTFYNKELDISTKHLVDIIYNIDDKSPSTMYTRKTKRSRSKLSLRAKRIPFSEYALKGQIIHKDLKSGRTKKKLDFTIAYRPSLKAYEVSYSNVNIGLTKEHVLDPSTAPYNSPIGKKFATLISNLSILHNTYLNEKNYYAIKDVQEYSILDGGTMHSNMTKLSKEKGNARFRFVSAVEDLAYCELNTKKTALKYVYDFSTGIVEGMTRVTVSESKNEVEQILVFRDN